MDFGDAIHHRLQQISEGSKIPKILVPTVGPEDWKRFLADPEKQWKRGYSAMAAALSWEAADGVPPEISELLGGSIELLLAIPEHKVALPGGRRESQCDVFALVRSFNETIAIVAAVLAVLIVGERLPNLGWIGVVLVVGCLVIITMPMSLGGRFRAKAQFEQS